MGTSQTEKEIGGGGCLLFGFFCFFSPPDGEADQIRTRSGPSYTPAALGQRHLSRLERTND